MWCRIFNVKSATVISNRAFTRVMQSTFVSAPFLHHCLQIVAEDCPLGGEVCISLILVLHWVRCNSPSTNAIAQRKNLTGIRKSLCISCFEWWIHRCEEAEGALSRELVNCMHYPACPAWTKLICLHAQGTKTIECAATMSFNLTPTMAVCADQTSCKLQREIMPTVNFVQSIMILSRKKLVKLDLRKLPQHNNKKALKKLAVGLLKQFALKL